MSSWERHRPKAKLPSLLSVEPSGFLAGLSVFELDLPVNFTLDPVFPFSFKKILNLEGVESADRDAASCGEDGAEPLPACCTPATTPLATFGLGGDTNLILMGARVN